jgi:hypothetical protein
MKVSLQDWLKFGWLKEHKTSRQEIADLLAVADRDLEACQTPALIPDFQHCVQRRPATCLRRFGGRRIPG